MCQWDANLALFVAPITARLLQKCGGLAGRRISHSKFALGLAYPIAGVPPGPRLRPVESNPRTNWMTPVSTTAPAATNAASADR